MEGSYDIHTHILPGVDDGARDEEETREMLVLAREQKIRHIIATPHFDLEQPHCSREELLEALERTRELAAKVDPEMTIALGNELLDSPGMLQALKEGRALTLGETRYILVEFLPQEPYRSIYNSLREYVTAGYIPVVAHMERIQALRKEYGRMEDLTELGAYFQMNADSLAGGIFDRAAAYHRSLVKDGYIHFLASDCHHPVGRKPLMEGIEKFLGREFVEGERYRNMVVEFPKKLLADELV